jgi:methionine sulfoxide reductase catalytic subunit
MLVDALVSATAATELGFPMWLRVTHFINFVFIGVLIRSGIEILSSHPRLYWNNYCVPGTDWIRFTKRVVPAEEGQYILGSTDNGSSSPRKRALTCADMGVAA